MFPCLTRLNLSNKNTQILAGHPPPDLYKTKMIQTPHRVNRVQASESFFKWRRERDLNPCIHSCITRFRIVRVRPLRHLCIVSIIYYPAKKINSFCPSFQRFFGQKTPPHRRGAEAMHPAENDSVFYSAFSAAALAASSFLFRK